MEPVKFLLLISINLIRYFPALVFKNADCPVMFPSTIIFALTHSDPAEAITFVFFEEIKLHFLTVWLNLLTVVGKHF